jgi:hypothetical protein
MSGSEAFQTYLRQRSLKLRIDADEAALFAHRGTRGVAREDVLRTPLREILPERFGISTGEVHASDGSTSGQLDLIIYDAHNAPRLYERYTSAVIPIECVFAVISVKSRIAYADVDATQGVAARLRQMPLAAVTGEGELLSISDLDPDFHARPAVYLYGFDGPQPDAIRDHVVASLAEEPYIRSLLNGIVVHGRGLVLPTRDSQPVGFLTEAQSVGSDTTGDATFGVFLSLLYAALTTSRRVAPRLGAYIDAATLVSSYGSSK